MQQVDDLEKLAALHQSGVLTDDEFNRAKKKIVGHLADPNKAPAWMKPAGWYTSVLAVGGCALCMYSHSQHTSDNAALFTSLATNPLFFLVLPLGLYWLYQADQL